MKHIILPIIYALSGLVLGAVLAYLFQMQARPDLSIWHQARLDMEFSAADTDRVLNLEDYRQVENTLFGQLEKLIYDLTPNQTAQMFNRYYRGSLSDPHGFETNWNRTFERPATKPRAAVLMLHGLSDSPYSLKSLAESLHRQNAWVVGLRLPGHGTTPAGLAQVHWRDFTAAVRLAARDLAKQTGPDCPLYLVGYSNGAALALEYTLSQMEGESLPKPAGLILISPAVTVTPMAALARFNLYLSLLPGLEKLAWLSIQPEYDPFKYNSFAVNAGHQIYNLTRRISNQIKKLSDDGILHGFPRTLAIQSVVDATIPPRGIVDNFLIHLAPGGHRLMLFDVNRKAEIAALFNRETQLFPEDLMSRDLPFELDLITNTTPDSLALKVCRKSALSTDVIEEALNLVWPEGIYSLSHVALPFPENDPVYGFKAKADKHTIELGRLEPRGEKDLLRIPISSLMRLRYNPFYNYMEQQVLEWFSSEAGSQK